MYQPWKELIPTDIHSRFILREVEDFVLLNNEEKSAIVNKMMQEEPRDSVDK